LRPEPVAPGEVRREPRESRLEQTARHAEPSEPGLDLGAGAHDEIPGIPGLERSPFAAMPARRTRPQSSEPERRELSGRRQPAASGDPRGEEDRWASAPAAPERQTVPPFVADLSDPSEIVVPVMLPRSAIRDRIEIRLVLRIVQEMEVPGEQRERPRGTDDLAASA
jgi:hypothetical protein